MENQIANYEAYIKFEMGENPGHVKRFWMGKSLEYIQQQKDSHKFDGPFSTVPLNDDAEIVQIVPENETEEEAFFRNMISEFKDKLSPYHQLTEITSAFRQSFAAAGVTDDIFEKTKNRADIVSSDDKLIIYGLDKAAYAEISNNLSKMKEVDIGLSLLPSSILLSLVATFDSIIADFSKRVLSLYPDRISAGDRTITYRQLLSVNDLNHVRNNLISEEINNMLRGSHADQVEFLERLTDTKIAAHYSRWPNFLEIFERRNCVAHNNACVSEVYLSKCDKYKIQVDKKPLGEKFDLRPRYLHKSIDTLIEFGTLLVFAAWQKLVKSGSAPAFGSMNEVCFDLLKGNRFDLAEWLLDFALHRQKRGGDEVTTRMMVVNLAIAYKKRGNDSRAEETLNEMDWSASSDLFILALASLRNDMETVKITLPRVFAAGEIIADNVRDWPVFDWIRSDPLFSDIFEEIFNEPLGLKILSGGDQGSPKDIDIVTNAPPVNRDAVQTGVN